MIWSVFKKVSQSNSRFNALDKLLVTVHSVKMPVGFRSVALKPMGRPTSAMAHFKSSIIEEKTEENCLAHALIIGIAKLNNDSIYKTYMLGRKISPVVQNLLETTGINLDRGGWDQRTREVSRPLQRIQNYRLCWFEL